MQRKIAERKKETTRKNNYNSEEKTDSDFSCYGCGNPNTLRPNCQQSNKEKEKNDKTSATGARFRMISTQNSGKQLCTILKIKVDNINGTVQLDTGATTSIASVNLCTVLKELEYEFEEDTLMVKLADESAKTRKLLYTDMRVQLMDKFIKTRFFMFTDTKTETTVLGLIL